MEKNEIPADVRRFVRANIPSIPHMEALMLLRTTSPARWPAAAVAERLYIAPEAARLVLADLSQAGVIRADQTGAAHFDPASCGALTALIDQLSTLYATQLVAVTMLIHSTHVRGGPAV